ncbi:glycoside hydrolase family 88 protein [Pedobacter cryoconitis]|uniref:Glycosyl hydrolase family 88 n=1 Tax=Pedobacter cryoconitis TaxID=188932 RepID=A0A327T6K3_9SPHI|nr:glycoside hydrolase family 88 protein [Pedobacter cryoconitis]RAJ37246.1 glycosyl hydrolase family 88 [Pedobacter cryoconitis]
MKKKINLIAGLLLLAGSASFAQKSGTQLQNMKQLIDEQFNFAVKQYKVLDKNIPAGLTPQSYDAKTNKLVAYDIKWWCSGFYSGSLWYIYEQTKDAAVKKTAEKALKVIEPNQHYSGNHDLGFMMFCSFGNAYRLTKDPAYKIIIDKSAASLAKRYRPAIESIQSWDKNKYWKCPVIIDNMMNLEMLNWVSDNGGDAKYKEISVKHANTALKNHFRPDFSSYHVVDYDLTTGKVNRKATWQGAADCSAWARGQAWALYGYTMMYRDTKDQKYLDQAKGIAHFILNHPNLPADKIPFWDFDAPKIPYAERDASAGAITASALLELAQYTPAGAEKTEFIASAETMIRSLSTPVYRAKLGENGGFLLLHSTGALPLNSEIDVPLVYADYYFLEALGRYKKWYL